LFENQKIYRFQDGSLHLVNEPTGEVSLAVADSWLVDEGRSLGAKAHFDRFANWVRESSTISDGEIAAFIQAVRETMPTEGKWFPRLELHSAAEAPNQLFLRLRKSPELQNTITLWTYPEADPRTNPQIKGPDLSLCQQMRRKATIHGADEAVILNSDGYIAEGALSSLVWWRDDALCAPGDDIAWLPSVTRELVLETAAQMGKKIRFESARPADLVGLEIWALSSLHGIRVVTDWLELGGPVGKARHYDSFQKRLRLIQESLRQD
jgi:branched-subunit amino acid aminotransferase/4-amino-4-deoxychorismate lyase